MATFGPTALPAFLDSDANFRTWAQGVHDKIIAVGMVQTADTGQINFSTVLRPGTANGVAGYAIYRFDDSLQATDPIFFKVEYGVGGAVDRPSLWTTVGTGSNGTGTLTGSVGARKQIIPSASKTAGVTLDTFSSGTPGRLSLVTHHDTASTNFPMMVLLERLRTRAGAESHGVFTYVTSQNLIQFQCIAQGVVGQNNVTTVHPFFLNLNSFTTETIAGSDVALCGAHFPFRGKWYRALPCLAKSGDVTIGTPITAENLGATRTLRPINMYGQSSNVWLLPWE